MCLYIERLSKQDLLPNTTIVVNYSVLYQRHILLDGPCQYMRFKT